MPKKKMSMSRRKGVPLKSLSKGAKKAVNKTVDLKKRWVQSQRMLAKRYGLKLRPVGHMFGKNNPKWVFVQKGKGMR